MFTPPKNDTKFSPATSSANGFSAASLGGSSVQAQTVIARGVRVEGDFRSQGHVTIEGELEGSITCGGHLTIGAEATIHASIQADEVTISGSVEGDIQATRRLELKATARIKGDLRAESLAMEAGAALDGRVQVGGVPVASRLPEKKEAPRPSVKPEEVYIRTPDEEKE